MVYASDIVSQLILSVSLPPKGTMGYIAILKYFDAVVVSMVMLVEPVVATFIGFAVGVDTLPGWVTWVSQACNNKLSALLPIVVSYHSLLRNCKRRAIQL